MISIVIAMKARGKPSRIIFDQGMFLCVKTWRQKEKVKVLSPTFSLENLKFHEY